LTLAGLSRSGGMWLRHGASAVASQRIGSLLCDRALPDQPNTSAVMPAYQSSDSW
jgi:hypothetical protein